MACNLILFLPAFDVLCDQLLFRHIVIWNLDLLNWQCLMILITYRPFTKSWLILYSEVGPNKLCVVNHQMWITKVFETFGIFLLVMEKIYIESDK